MPKLPPQLLNSLSKFEGFNEKEFVAVHESGTRLTSVRINPFKKTGLDFNIEQPVPWNSHGFYLEERPYFTHDPLFHAGCYYVQEAGSMFLELALKQTLDLSQDLKILDLCAAPGGKSTLINSLLSPESLLVANDPIRSRAGILAQNLSRWGTANCIVTNNHPERYSATTAFFDAIIVDAPCSGSGLFRKQPEAIDEWSEETVKACSIRQKDILENIIPALKEDGILFYSTCSYSIEENEEIVEWLCAEKQMNYMSLKIENNWGIVESPCGYRFYPHLTKSEGFFCAVLRKNSGEKTSNRSFRLTSGISKAEADVVKDFIKSGAGIFNKINGRIHYTNLQVADFMGRFGQNFYYKKAGTFLGEIKGGKLVPEQELAWSVNLGTSFEKLDLDKNAAVNYLKKENFLTGGHEQNLVLACYRQFGLGWAKILPNRINNYLPPELRIMK